jgi:methionyl-tRNA formyltransferase
MRVVFIGTGEIGVPTLRALQESEHELVALVTQPDKPAGRKQKIEPPPIKRAIGNTHLPVLQPARIKDQESLEQIGAQQPDVIVVIAYGQILPPALLAIPRLACLNLHASLLPRWRGAAPIQAAIAAGDAVTGITVMYMNEGLDTGDILLQKQIEILPADTGGTVHDRLGQIAPESLLESLKYLARGVAPRIKQDEARATHAPKLNRESGRIDWSEPAETIERKVRAFDPWPGAFMTLTDVSGKASKLKIFRAEVLGQKAKPGELRCFDAERVVVGTGTYALSLQEVQLEGKRRMSAGEFLRGYRL